jgi:UDP-2,3-diacylglucosamine hydrolase
MTAPQSPKVAIFSDLHLSKAQPAQEKLFIDLLQRLRSEEKITHLWLLGDIYDLMVGPYAFWRQEHAAFFAELSEYRKAGIEVLWLEGNHDFYLQKLLEEEGIEAIDGDCEKTVAGHRVFLSHGDRVNPHDKPYLRWRAFTRSRGFRALLDRLPPRWRSQWLPKVGQWMSEKSRAQNRPLATDELKQLYRNYVRERFAEGYDQIFMGHCHIEDDFREGGRHYLNLGSWVNYSPRYGLWTPLSDRFPKLHFS